MGDLREASVYGIMGPGPQLLRVRLRVLPDVGMDCSKRIVAPYHDDWNGRMQRTAVSAAPNGLLIDLHARLIEFTDAVGLSPTQKMCSMPYTRFRPHACP